MKKMLLLLAMLAAIGSSAVFAQERKISGRVTSPEGDLLPGATVKISGTTRGTTTDANGRFEIAVNPGEQLEVSSIGYDKQVLTAPATGGELQITLQPSAHMLNEAVVTALGITQEKRKLGYSVTEIKGSELAATNEVNPIDALQGKVAGVQIDQGAGGLFGTSKILIRGNSTLGNNNQPIFVVDGVIMDNGIFSGNGRDFGNDLKDLNMEDFESVSVLKGSAAAALYGSRAINGVILITTKKGSARKGIGVNITQSVNISQPYAGPEFQNEYGGGSVGAFFTDHRDPNYKPDEAWRTKVFPVDPVSGKPYIDQQMGRELENWGPRMEGQEVLNYDGTPTRYLPQPDNFMQAFQNGTGFNTHIALDGGNEKSTFRFSYTRTESKGVVPNNKLLKNGFDLRVTHKLNSFLDVDAGVDYTSFDGKNPPRLGGLDAFASYNFGKLFTWMLPRNYNTGYWMQQDKYTSQFGGVPNPADPNEPNKVPEARFWFTLFENEYLQKEQMMRGRLTLTAHLTDWAQLQLEGNINNLYTKNENKELGQGQGFTGGMYGLGHSMKGTYFLKWLLTVNRPISKNFSFSGYVGGEKQRYQITYNYSETRGGLNYPGNYFLSNSVLPQFSEGGTRSSKAMNSLYGSASFSYKDQLYLDATWRGDWSSALTYANGTGNNFYNYPAASLSWIFTETFSLPRWITFGKFRTNIAALGNDTDPFVLNPGFEITGFANTNGTDIPISTYTRDPLSGKYIALAPNLKPERKVAKELGLEMRFFDSRLGFDFSYYRDNTYDQILDIGTPPESGIEGIKINAGNIQNQGIEVMIDAVPVKTNNFEWTTTANYSRNRNLIVDLYTGRNEYNLRANVGEISTWAIVGKSYGTLRTTIHSKPFQAVDAEGKPVANENNGKPILAWRSDARAAFPARSNELMDVGDINARFRGGWGNTFRYKNFSLNVLLDAKIGGDFVLLTYRYGTHTGVFPNTLKGRDAAHGGITWTSKYDGQTYDDGMIPEGVFPIGQMITQPDGSQVDVGGLTFQQAYEKGYVEPTHTPQFFYRYGSSSTGVSDYWIFENSWVSLRQVALTYNFSPQVCKKLKLNNLSISLLGRDLLYLYNSLPYNYNPASNNSNNTAFSGEEGFLPMIRNITGTIRVGF